MGFYRQRTKCQFLHGPTYSLSITPTYGSTHTLPMTTPGPPPWPTHFGPAANNDDAQPPSLPYRHRPHFNPTTMPGIPQNHRTAAAPAVPPRRRHCISRPHSIAAPPSPNSHSAGQTQPAHPVTQLAASTQSLHLVTTFSHQQHWCAKPARPAPAQPSGAAQGRL